MHNGYDTLGRSYRRRNNLGRYGRSGRAGVYWRPFDYPQYPGYYQQSNPYSGYYQQPQSPFIQPIIQQPVIPQNVCGCMTCDVPYTIGSAIKGGRDDVCMGNTNKCRPGDDRCWCYDSCNGRINGGRGWNCSNTSAGGQGVPLRSMCNNV